jgi:hypothetical protein
MSTESPGQCTDRILGLNFTYAEAAAALAANLATCNSIAERGKCLAQKRCMWRLDSDNCFCTFDGCSCASPVGVWNQSAAWPRQSMALVLMPSFALVICVCCSAGGYIYRRKVSKLLVAICPDSVINKLSYKSVLETEVEKVPVVKTEPPEDSDEEEEDGKHASGDKKKKKKKTRRQKQQELKEYRGDWMLTVTIERAQHLPRLDSTLRDPSLIGYAGSSPIGSILASLRGQRSCRECRETFLHTAPASCRRPVAHKLPSPCPPEIPSPCPTQRFRPVQPGLG